MKGEWKDIVEVPLEIKVREEPGGEGTDMRCPLEDVASPSTMEAMYDRQIQLYSSKRECTNEQTDVDEYEVLWFG